MLGFLCWLLGNIIWWVRLILEVSLMEITGKTLVYKVNLEDYQTRFT